MRTRRRALLLLKGFKKRIQEEHPHYQLIKRRDEIEKKLRVKNENRES